MNHHLFWTLILVSSSAPALAQAASAPAASRPVTRAAFLQRIDSNFAAIDSNKDGFTDKAEIEAAETRAMANRKSSQIKQREAAFQRLDKDRNGSLSLQEFNSEASAQQVPKANAAPRLARLDTNKDGKISAAENRAPAVARFDRLDTNKDGTLSAQEQQARPRR